MKIRTLFEDGRAPLPVSGYPSDLEGGGPEELDAVLRRVRAGRERLRSTPIDTIIGLCDSIARTWVDGDRATAQVLKEFDMGYVPLSMRADYLRRWCDFSLRGTRMSVDRFVALGEGASTLYRAQPRGLIVHWIAGNVPVLGMLSLLQGLLTKNANVIKAPERFAGLLPYLLQSMSQASWTDSDGVTHSGRLLTDAVGVIYAERDDIEAARELSRQADIRVAWGSKDAVEAIMNVPRRFGTEDIVFGPKQSFVVIGKEMLEDDAEAERLADSIVRDASAFDQQGCNSPHTVFVETGGRIAPAEFAQRLANAFRRLCENQPLSYVSPADAFDVVTLRAEYEMRGQVHSDAGLEWTVVFDENDEGLATPCYLRTLFVRSVEDIFSIPGYCSVNTQTVGLALNERRAALADALTANGVERCPNPGNMMLYDTPWDGMFPMERMVRWVSLAA